MKKLLIAAAVLLVPAWALAQSEAADPPADPASPSGTTTGTGTMGKSMQDKSMSGENAETLTKSQLINKLHHANTMEIEVGNLAQTHARSAKVKQFGETIVKDHTKADKDVMDFAKNNNIVLSEAGIGAGKSTGSAYKSGESTTGTAGEMGSTTGSYKKDETTTGSTGSTSEQYGMKESKRAKIDQLSNLQGDAFDRAFLTMMVTDHERVINLLETNRGKENDKKLDALIDKLLPTLRDHQRTAERLQREVPSAS